MANYTYISYAIEVFSLYYSNLRPIYCNLRFQIFRYLSKTLDLRITFTTNSKDKLIGYTNSDYTKLIDCQKSIGSYILLPSGRFFFYKSKL